MRATLFVAAAMVVAFSISLIVRSVGSYYAPLDGWGVAGFEMSMGLLCGARFYERSWRSASSLARAMPLVLGGACVSWGIGDLTLTAVYGGNAPVPSAADAFYAGFFPLAFLSLMLLARRGNAKSLVKTGLDGLIAGLGAASLCAAYLFEPVRRAIGGSALSAATKMAYPVGDLLLLALMVGGFAVLPRRYRRFLVLTSVAMAANATGDLFNLLQPDSRVGFVANGAAWPVALLMVATAMWTLPARAERVDHDRADDFALPTVGVVASMFILFTDSFGHASQIALGLATATLVVAGVRMALNVHEGHTLKTARFRSLIDKTWDLIMVAEQDLSVAYITPSSQRVLGYDPSELQGKAISATVHPDDAALLSGNLAELATRSTDSAAFEIRMRHRNGAWRTIAWTATNLIADPSVRGYVLNGSDVTEARQAAADLAAARDGALMASQAKSQFLSMMSHEIRTPMNGVIGLTELLLATSLDPDQRELANGIKVSAESLLVIINDILDFSKIEAGKLDLEEAPLDVPGLIDDIGRVLAGPAHKKGLELIIDVGADVPGALLGDHVRLQQVLLNLGSNAVKFTAHGEVVIRAMVLHENTERVALRFEVVDMGIGIAPEDQKRLFQAFAQADSSTTRRFGGTGLGLAISRELVELMGGRLGLVSAPGEGSTFWFEVSLPRGEGIAEATSDRDTRSVAGLRALIVDDNTTNRRILRQHLLSWGAEPAEAHDAYEAIQIAAAAVEAGQPFDIGVVDLNMPGMDGIELARHLKTNPATASTTLFLLSSSGERLGAAESHLCGFAASLTKPVRSSELFDCLIDNLTPDTAAIVPPPQPDSDQLCNGEIRGVILLVEDNRMNQLVGSKALAKLGYSVDIANDGREAVSAVGAKAYDAVLMDCQMPQMDGYEATAEIRKTEGNARHTPIIAMTAAAMEGDREKCIAAGMDDYISKPVRLDVIADVLERWTQRSKAHQPDEGACPPDRAPEALDEEQIDRLRSLDGGDGSLLGEIIAQYLSQTTEGRDQLERVVVVGDAEALQATAHAIKGASANVGAKGLAEVCAEIERCGRQADLEEAAGLVERFDAEFARVRDALTLVAPRSWPCAS